MQTASTHPASQRTPSYPWQTPADWYLRNKRYFAYMLRELTAVFAALWVILFLWQLPSAAAGAQDLPTYLGWVNLLHSPWWVIFSMVAFFMVCYHAITWFILMGTVMWMRFGKAPVPGRLIIASMFIAWLVVSLVIAFFIATPIIGS
jgi:fumarate reductase subunit C